MLVAVVSSWFLDSGGIFNRMDRIERMEAVFNGSVVIADKRSRIIE